MTEKYAGKADDRVYAGSEGDITYSAKRCLHAEECVTRLADVFDVTKRRWIDANGASAERIAAVIQTCPSGALHYHPKGESLAEVSPTTNRIVVQKDGYLRLMGDLSIQGAQVQIEDETRATLCRCGASHKKPFCDNTHKEIEFQTPPLTIIKEEETVEQGGQLVITAQENGPYEVVGNFQIEDDDGAVIFTGSKTWLCRCGGSSKKPFCDSTHKKNGFSAE